ncbi:MAG: TonB-dependent receptor [Tannerellaceae bacterium]|jgi:TonB-linked SusC/RagA family outer membrane protein|nr:TonB-dependent receptor [Tannerellaceae bacterium]
MKRKYKILKNLFAVCLYLIAAIQLQAQDAQTVRRVQGRVTDAGRGDALIGVNVLVEGTTSGATTDLDGRFTIDNVPANATLHVSYIGYLTQEISVNNRQVIDVELAEDTQRLDEVVVVGYGSFKKRDLTGAVSQVKGEDIAGLPLRSASDALQGKAAGVTITSTSGSPGSMGTVRIRGVGTLNDNNPLYVVDGLPQTSIGWLNARDIESIEVLKDASAQAIYGARAANGVILVSTKRGLSEGAYRSVIEFDMNIGFQNIVKRYDMLDAEGFMEYKNRAYTAAGREPMDDFATPEKREQILSFLAKNGSRSGTDWWKETTRPMMEAPLQTYNLSLSGGMDKLRYRASFNYMDQKGILKGSDYERLSGRLNVDSEVTKWLNFSANTVLVYESRRNIDENNAYLATVFNTVTADPITPVYRDNLKDIPDFLQGRIMSGYEPTNPYSRYTGVIYSNKSNAVAQVERMSLSVWTGILSKSNVSAEIKLFPFLTYKSSIALDLGRSLSDGFTPKYYLDGDEYSTYASVSKFTGRTDYWVFDNYLTFNDRYDRHAVNAMIGTSAEKNRYEEIGASKQGMVNNDPNQRILNAGTLNPGASGYINIHSLNSYFGRVFYSFDDKYMVTANIRWDGSSAFAKGNKWGMFPSVSAGWNFSQEDFLKNAGWLSQGKLRAAWGEIGNQNIYRTAGAYLNTYGNSSYYLFGNPNQMQLSGGRGSVGNPDLKWETTSQLDFGLDLAFLHGSLRLTLDYFDRKTSDMLLQLPLPTSLGLPNYPWMNAGSVSNKGLEFTLVYDGVAAKDFAYHINANVSTYRNRVESLGSGSNIPGKGIHLGNQTYTMTEVGQPIGYFYGFETDGVFQTPQEVDNYAVEGKKIMPSAQPGDLRFVDRNHDGVLDELDRTMIGNPHPDFTFGLTLGAEYKGFDFSAFFQGSIGNDILNILKYDIYSGTGWYNAPKDILTTFWSGPGSTDKNFSIDANSRMNLEMSDWYIEDGSYVRLKNIQIGYTLPNRLTQKITVSDLRFFLAVQNLFTLTGYSGLDPEIGSDNPQYMGIDMGFYPQARTCMFGVSMKL